VEDNFLKDDIKHYEKLSKINDSQEFNDFFDLQIKTVADKLLWSVTGDNIKSWDDFCKLRGEIIAYLYPIQEIRGSKAMKKQLTDNLNEYYGKQI
jgi:hypothetical protein